MATRELYEAEFDETGEKQLTETVCPECEGTLKSDGGETACLSCGLILEDYRLDRRGRRSFPDDAENKERTGAPLTFGRHDRGLSTEIGYKRDANGNFLQGRKRRQVARMRREHTRARWRSTKERNLAHGCGEIARLVSVLDITRDTREEASALFRRAQSEELLCGRSVEAIATGCVYAICRCRGLTRTFEEIAAVAQCPESALNNAYRTLNRELSLPTPPRRPREFIAGFASDLEVSSAIEHRARELTLEATEAGLSNGVHPGGFAAACLGVAADNHEISLTQMRLADVANVSPSTIRAHRTRLRDGLEMRE
jgi:transcription initiation factor TFIIB